jgi:hypothetical protein
MSEFGLPTSSFPPAPPASAAPPGGATLRGPMTFGQILDRVLQLMRSNWPLFVRIALAPALGLIAYFGIIFAAFFPVLKLIMLHQTVGFSPMKMASLGTSLGLAYVVGILLMVVIYALYEPAGIYAALEANAGKRVTFRAAWAVSWNKAGRYVWLSILRAAIVMLPMLVFGALIAGTLGLSMAHGSGSMDPSLVAMIVPLFMLLYLAWFVYTVLIMLRLVLAVPASVTEDLSAWRSLRRSNQLTHGAKGRIFLLGLLIYAIAYAVFLVVEVVIFFLGAMAALVGMMLHLALAPWGYAGIGVGVVVFACAYLVWVAAAASAYCTLFAVVYHDQRLRLEGIAATQAG